MRKTFLHECTSRAPAILVIASLALSACGGGGVSPGNGGGGGGGSPGQLRFSGSALTVGEAAGDATLMIERVAGSTGAISVRVTSTGGTATAGQDYTGVATTIRFADGDSAAKPVSFAINNDAMDEQDETVLLALSDPTGGATLLSPAEITTTVTIRDDDNDVAPAAASLVTAAEVKKLAFSWRSIANATFYRFVRRETPTADFVQIGPDLPSAVGDARLNIPVHLYQWDDAGPQYRLDACNATACTPSNVVGEVRVSSVVATGYIKASDTSAGAQFGSAVAVSSDGKTVAIGAPFANGEAGNVYVYIAPVAGPVLAPNPVKISAPSAQAMHFGASVALSEDGNTLVVGAPFDNHAQTGVGTYPAAPNANAAHSGGVFVYSRVGNVWSSTPVYIKASDADADDEFGSAVALRDTVLVVGAPRQNDSGAAYAFYANAGTWAQAPGILEASSIGNGNLFGSSVAVTRAGAIIIIGAPNEDANTSPDSGAAYAFRRTDGGGNAVPTWSPAQRLPAGVGGAGDLYGTSVAVSATGDVFAVSAPNEDDLTTHATDAGAVYVYTETQALLTDVAHLNATHGHSGARFGASLAINSDGSIIVAGSPNEFANEVGVDGRGDAPLSAANSGAVDVLVRQAGANWSAQGNSAPKGHYIKSNNTGAQDLFGTAVSLNGDGNTLVVGASGEDGNGRNIDTNNNPADDSVADSGAAYLF
jgi:hypothetical protein